MRFLPLAAVSLAMAAPAAAAPAGLDLRLKRVTEPPASVAAGDDLIVKAKVKNTGERRRGGRIKMHIIGGSGVYAVPRRIARFRVGKIDPGYFKRYTVRLTVPHNLGAGRYRLRTCLKATGQRLSCDVSRRFRVTG